MKINGVAFLVKARRKRIEITCDGLDVCVYEWTRIKQWAINGPAFMERVMAARKASRKAGKP